MVIVNEWEWMNSWMQILITYKTSRFTVPPAKHENKLSIQYTLMTILEVIYTH